MKNFFENIQPLKPIPTETKKQVSKASGIKAVLFDVYGTLLISSSGDIGTTELKGQTALQAFQDCNISTNSQINEVEIGKLIVAEYEEEIIQVHDQARKDGVKHPEVDIVKIWDSVLKELQATKIITYPENLDLQTLSIAFEFYNNSVYPMPNFKESLKNISDLNLELGIISNAQFFTPLLLQYFLLGKFDIQDLPYFNPQLLIYSYQYGHAKPDVFLYKKMEEQLKTIDISPEECLYVGNDMLNDIYPASKLGFQTVLFAGDTRSLRLRRTHSECQNLSPDFIITDLSQLKEII